MNENHGHYTRRGRGGPYRSRDGMICGVCKGLADHFEVEPVWIRLAFVLFFFLGAGILAILAYVILAVVLKPEPVLPLESEEDEEFYNSYTMSHKAALHRLKKTFDNLDRRIQRMEDIVTKRDYDWERRFNG